MKVDWDKEIVERVQEMRRRIKRIEREGNGKSWGMEK